MTMPTLVQAWRRNSGSNGMIRYKFQNRNRVRSTTGFTVIECLIALAISAILMTAMAVAFNASVVSYTENEDMFEAMNNARQALTRMTRELRTGHLIDTTSGSNECSFFTADDEDITYEYRSADNKLYLITNSDSSEYVLCDGVTSLTFTRILTDDGTDCKSVQITMTVQCDDTTQTLAAAAAIRRNL